MTSAEINSKILDEIDTVYQKMSNKHSGKFDADRLRMRAHFINKGKHSSFETPPDYPFLRIRDKNTLVSTPKSTDGGSASCSTSSAQLRHLFRVRAFFQLDDPA